VIEFSLARPSHVHIDVFDVLGRKVSTVVDQELKAGTYSTFWDGTDDSGKEVASGVYFYRLRAGDHAETKKMVLLK